MINKKNWDSKFLLMNIFYSSLKNKITSTIIIILFSNILYSCTDPIQENVHLQNDRFLSKNDSLLNFVNRINAEEIELPLALNLTPMNFDTLDFTSVLNEDYSSYSIYLKNSNVDTLKLENLNGFSIYKEGDIDGDGFEEIGILYSASNGSCRTYSLYSIKKNKWNLLQEVNTHLPDREIGIDYFKREGEKVRIISASSESCCQCLELDTIYTNHQ